MIWSRNKHFQITIPVAGIRCNHCESSIKLALGKISGVGRVKIRQRKYVVVKFDSEKEIDLSELTTAIENTGYSVIVSELSLIL
jgi:copper chaperone CopZ